MTPIINPWLFYAVNFLVNLQDACSIVLIVCGVAMAFLTLNGLIDEDEEKLKANKKNKQEIVSCFIVNANCYYIYSSQGNLLSNDDFFSSYR